ncbi:lysylphosphatidylglycerol synthase transmembrane domain-containing protein [soil metagenome]
MRTRLKTILAALAGAALGALLLYLALRGVDLATVGQALRDAEWWWAVPLTIVVLLSHWLRAWRWRLLLSAADVRGITTVQAFSSLMVGYMANYAAPRFGEIARCAHLGARTRTAFSTSLGTVVSERLLDVLVLILAILSIPVLLAGELAPVMALFRPSIEVVQDSPFLWGATLVAALVTLMLLFALGRRLLARVRASERPSVLRFREAGARFKGGLFSLLRVRERATVALITLAMWFCYAIMAYIPLVMLGISQVYALSLVDAWVLMVVGSAALIVPSPGGTGSYHYVTVQAMMLLFAVAPEPAATYALLTHAAQLILYALVGVIILSVQRVSLRALLQRPDPETVPTP